ncbi:MAG: DUF4190 domain-containing protein [Ignavibacteria bacterium]|nr:DUF4190 domain-containing protein [Ignavibacteria bacterium]
MNNNLYFQDSGNTGFVPPPPPPPPPPMGGSQYSSGKASSNAIWALVLGILSWVLCGIFAAIPAWIIGKKEISAIEAGQSDPSGKTMAQIGMWLGIIQVILGILGIIVVIILLALGVLGSAINH